MSFLRVYKMKYLVFSTVLFSVLSIGQVSAGLSQSKPNEPSYHQETRIYRLNIHKEYLDYIIQGKKIVEGRLNLPKFVDVKPGDIIYFWDNEGESAICTITSVGRYDNFSKMLVANGVVNMIPIINPELYTAKEMVEIGVQMYESLPGYKDGVKIYGSIAFGVRYDGDGKANLLPNLSDN